VVLLAGSGEPSASWVLVAGALGVVNASIGVAVHKLTAGLLRKLVAVIRPSASGDLQVDEEELV